MSGATPEDQNPLPIAADPIAAAHAAALLTHLMDCGNTESALAIDPRTTPGTLDELARKLITRARHQHTTFPGQGRPAMVNELVDLAANPSLAPETFVLLNLFEFPEVRVTAATNPSCPSLVLAVFAQDPDPLVRQAVAAHKSTPVDTLVELSSDRYSVVTEAIIANPNTPMPILTAMLGDQPDLPLLHAAVRNPRFGPERVAKWATHSQRTVRRLVAAHPNLPREQQEDLAWTDDPTCQALLASNPSLDPGIAEAFSNPAGPVSTRLALANNRHIPVHIMTRMLVDPEWKVRSSAATDPRLQPQTLVQALADEENSTVVESIAGHPNLPNTALLQLLERLAFQSDHDLIAARTTFINVAYVVARRPESDAALLNMIAQRVTNATIRQAVLIHPMCPPQRLATAVLSGYRWERAAVAANPTTSEELLFQLAMDTEPLVRFLVTRNPNCTDAIATLVALVATPGEDPTK